MHVQRSGKTGLVTGESLRIVRVTARSYAKDGCDVAPRACGRAYPGAAADPRVVGEANWEKALQLKFMGYVRCLRNMLPITVARGQGAWST